MESQRKVIFINRYFYPDHSATSQMLSDLAFDLSKRGMRIEIVTSRLRYDDAKAQLPAQENIDGVTVHRVWTSRFGRQNLIGRALDYLTFYVTAGWKLFRLTDEHTTVVAKTDPPLISVVAAVVTRLRGARLINWLQDLFPEVAQRLGVKFMRWPLYDMLKWLRNWSLKVADNNVAIGSLMEELVNAEVEGVKTTVIHNWADGEALKPIPRDENPLRKTWGLDGKFVVGYSGNIGRAHQFEAILDAAETLKDNEEIVFLFIGSGAQRDELSREVSLRGLTNVLFKDYQPREILSQSLSVADIHLVSLNPALEGLIVPSKFYGIAAAGRATIFIGDPDGEIARILEDGSAGAGFSHARNDQLSILVEEYFTRPELVDTQGNAARALFESLFGRSEVVNGWGRLLGK